MKFSPQALLASAVALTALGLAGTAQIERLDLPTMVAKTDNCVFGTIVDKHVVRIDHEVDGPELYFTTLTIEGRSLETDAPLTVDVSFPGGFVSPTEGVRNSEAPSNDDIQIGNQIVAFYKHSENMGGDFAGNALYASHGGLFRAFERNGTIIQGRGEGYALPVNVRLPELKTQVTALAAPKHADGKKQTK